MIIYATFTHGDKKFDPHYGYLNWKKKNYSAIEENHPDEELSPPSEDAAPIVRPYTCTSATELRWFSRWLKLKSGRKLNLIRNISVQNLTWGLYSTVLISYEYYNIFLNNGFDFTEIVFYGSTDTKLTQTNMYSAFIFIRH